MKKRIKSDVVIVADGTFPTHFVPLIILRMLKG